MPCTVTTMLNEDDSILGFTQKDKIFIGKRGSLQSHWQYLDSNEILRGLLLHT